MPIGEAYGALHKEADDVGNIPLAWDALGLMCRAKRKVEFFDAQEECRLLQRLKAFPVSVPDVSSTDDGLVPIFIVGMHRSGTTLLEQMLAANPQVRALGELSDFPAALRYVAERHGRDIIDSELLDVLDGGDLSQVGAVYLRGVAWRLQGTRWFTDKQPGNYRAVGLICQALPRARILHMVRDPLDVCFSKESLNNSP